MDRPCFVHGLYSPQSTTSNWKTGVASATARCTQSVLKPDSRGYGPFLLKLLVTVNIMCKKKKFFKCAINVVKAVQVNISNAYMKLQSMN